MIAMRYRLIHPAAPFEGSTLSAVSASLSLRRYSARVNNETLLGKREPTRVMKQRKQTDSDHHR